MKKMLVVVLIVVVVVTQGCASAGTHTKSGAKKGAIWGALSGAATALLTGRSIEEAVAYAAAGAAVGAAAGAAIGAAKDRKVAERNAAVEQYAYNASQGYLINIEDVKLSNNAPAQGEEVVLLVRYTAISPKESSTIKVKGTPVIVTGEDVFELGSFSSTIPNGGGTMQVEVPITLDIPKGSYALKTDLRVRGESATDSSQVNFYVG